VRQCFVFIRFVEIFGFNLIRDAVQEKAVVVLCDGVNVATDFERVLKGLLHRHIEPEFNAGSDEVNGKEEEDYRR